MIVADLVDYINSKKEYRKYRYQSFSGESRLAYVHGKGSNEHIHLAIHSKYSLPENKPTLMVKVKSKIKSFL